MFRKDETGKRYTRLRVIGYAGDDDRGYAKWLCECDCGNRKEVLGTCLRKGSTKSCGCLHGDVIRTKLKRKSRTNALDAYDEDIL